MKLVDFYFINIRFILFLLFLNLKYIKGSNSCQNCAFDDTQKKCTMSPSCTGNNCVCSSNCRPHLNSGCYDCTSVFNLSPFKIYAISGETCVSPPPLVILP